jgi:hypothetical protein
VIERRNLASRAMNPGAFAASGALTTVHGLPSIGLKPTSKPCASSAMTPM